MKKIQNLLLIISGSPYGQDNVFGASEEYWSMDESLGWIAQWKEMMKENQPIE